MKIYLLEKCQIVPRGIHEVFEFFKDPANLARLTPASLGFEILTPAPIIMEKGRLIDYSIKVLGARQRWTTLITHYDPPYRFVDEQLRGPYSFWHHTHTFEPSGGGTKITDEVHFAIPFGFLGEIAYAVFIKHELERIFAYRRHVIESFFGSIPETNAEPSNTETINLYGRTIH